MYVASCNLTTLWVTKTISLAFRLYPGLGMTLSESKQWRSSADMQIIGGSYVQNQMRSFLPFVSFRLISNRTIINADLPALILRVYQFPADSSYFEPTCTCGLGYVNNSLEILICQLNCCCWFKFDASKEDILSGFFLYETYISKARQLNSFVIIFKLQ